jgi:hypothetical protein
MPNNGKPYGAVKLPPTLRLEGEETLDAEKYPEGKIAQYDHGAFKFLVGNAGEKVALKFSAPVAWLAFPPETAVSLAESLIQSAMAAGLGKHVRIVVEEEHS